MESRCGINTGEGAVPLYKKTGYSEFRISLLPAHWNKLEGTKNTDTWALPLTNSINCWDWQWGMNIFNNVSDGLSYTPGTEGQGSKEGGNHLRKCPKWDFGPWNKTHGFPLHFPFIPYRILSRIGHWLVGPWRKDISWVWIWRSGWSNRWLSSVSCSGHH